MQLPLFKGFTDQVFQLFQSRWQPILNPVISNALVNGQQIGPFVLTATTPLIINHLLNRMQLGYFITSLNANAVIWQTQPFNTTTLTLESSSNATISLWVY